MFKIILRLVIIGFVTWFLSPIFNVFLPFPTEAMVEGIINPENAQEKAVLQFLRFLVWIFFIYLILYLIRPAFEFLLPTARRYSVTKPVRRLHGITAELVLLAFFFCIFSAVGFVLTLPNQFDALVEAEMATMRTNMENELIQQRDQAYNKLLSIVKQGNEVLNKEIELRKNSISPYIPVSSWLSMPGFPESYPGRPENYLNYSKQYRRQSKDIEENPFYRGYQPEGARTIKSPNVTFSFAFINKRMEYAVALKEYEESKELAEKSEEVSKTVFEEKGSSGSMNYTSIRSDIENQTWEEIKEYPFSFMAPAFNSFWFVALILALFLYGLSHLPVRYSLAERYEKILRFFEQARFGLGGSARFAGLVEEWASLYKNQKYGLFLGRSLYNPYLTIGIEDPRHMVTIAGSRAGKGATAIIPNLLLWEGSAIVIDPKGTNAAVTARQRREMGQNVYLVDPFNIVNDSETDAFNPLSAIDPESPTIREQINIIAEALVVPEPAQKEKHWDDGARIVIAGLIGHLISSENYTNPTLPMIRDLISLSPDDQTELWIDMILNKSAGRLPSDAASRIMRGISTNEITSILSNADKHTEWLSSSAIQTSIEKSTFDFAEIKENPTTIYLILPPSMLETHNRFLRLFLNLALAQMSIGGRSKIPVLMMMDEFLALGRMQEVERAFGLLAGYNLIMWPFIQDLGRLKDIYKNSVNAFINNSRAIQVFGVFDGETTTFVSEQLGDRTLKPYRSNIKSNSSVKMRSPSEVSLDISRDSGREYILRSGKAPFLLEKVPYYSDPLFSEKFDKDPDYV